MAIISGSFSSSFGKVLADSDLHGPVAVYADDPVEFYAKITAVTTGSGGMSVDNGPQKG